MSYEAGENVVIYPGTVIGEGCRIGDNVVLGKRPVSPRSTAKREELPPLELGEGTVVSTGSKSCSRNEDRRILGDQAAFRALQLGDDIVVGRGSLVENDTTIGARTKIQANTTSPPTRRSRRTSSSPRAS